MTDLQFAFLLLLFFTALVLLRRYYVKNYYMDEDEYEDRSDIYMDCGTCGYNPDGLGCRNEKPHQFYCSGNPPRWECEDWKERER